MRSSFQSLIAIVFAASLLGCGSGDSEVAESSTTSNETGAEMIEPSDEGSSNPPTAALPAAPVGKVLRHAVFFSFKEESSEADVKGVVDAFRSLPGKIEAIEEFAWGTNNSPEGFDDGFTHCFFLTFKDQAGLQEYIPHPAHSGEFADVLRPHMKDVFVIDYWGSPSESAIENELKHAVFFKFKDDADPEAVKKVEESFAALPGKIDAIKAFEWGINNSPEGKDDGFTHAFMVSFDSEAGREEYLPHPDHQAFVKVLEPVLDKVRVLDFSVAE